MNCPNPSHIVQVNARLPNQVQITRFADNAANPIRKFKDALEVGRVRGVGNVIIRPLRSLLVGACVINELPSIL